MLRSGTVRILVAAAGASVFAGGVLAYRPLRREGSADALLAKADDLAWKNQWLAAAPLYTRAEHLFMQEGRPSQGLYAHVSQFIPRAESEALPSLLLELQRAKSQPAAHTSETMLRILVIEGMIESNYDASMARQTWQQVEHIAVTHGHYLLATRAIGEQGIASFLLGDIASAKTLVRRAWIAAECLHDPAAHVRYASVYGAGLVEVQRYDEALHALDEAINTAAHSPGVAYPSIAIYSKIDALRGLHRYEEALSLADSAVQRLPGSSLDAHLFQILTAKGEIYGDLGRWDDAAAQYTHALDYARHLDYWRGITQTGGLLAQAIEKKGDLYGALAAIDEAIRANAQLPAELYYAPRNLAFKAEILDKLGRAQESRALYEKSLTMIDSLVATAPTPDAERGLLTQLSLVYTGYFDLLLKAGDLADAFRTVERARGRIEAQALEDHAAAPPHDVTPREQEIAQLNLKLLGTDDLNPRTSLEQQLYDAEFQTDTTMLTLAAAKRPLALRTVQQHLRANEVVLEYVLADPVSWVLAITSQGVHKYNLASRSTIESDLRRYRKAIHDRLADPALAQTLFNELVAPVAEYRTSTSLIVIPDGGLHLLPTSALWDGSSYVLTSHVVSVSPSSTVLCLLRDREKATLQDTLGYVGVAAWPDSSKEQNVPVRSIPFLNERQFPPLPESKTEVEEIAHDFPDSSTVLLGPDATETRFKELPLSEYRVLHLALHGYADLEYPDRSALVFAPEKTGPDDGLLQAREIRNLRLKARLVTLSACDTGVGPIGEADIANLGNAFIEAGAESVVTTLWELDDRPTERLMAAFYRNLARHDDKVTALRDAQLDLAQAGLPPYYWAGFEMIGDPAGTL